MPPNGNKGAGASAVGGAAGAKSGLNPIRGTNNADTLLGAAGDDWVDGKGGDDLLFGRAGNDLIEGDQGNDTLIGGSGDDHLDGGHGTDVALYADDSTGTVPADVGDYYSVFDYDIVIGAGSTTITDTNLANGDTGSDTLTQMEQAVFSDGDADGDGTVSLLTVFVDGQNNAVLAVADYGAGEEDQDIVFQAADLIANDVEFDGDAKELISVQDAVNGTVSLAPDGTITFTPAADFSGQASFTYTVSDGRGGADTQTVTIEVGAVADAPVITAAPAAGDEDSAIALNLSVAPGDGDGSETITSLIVSGIPDGAVLSDGVNEFAAGGGIFEAEIVSWNWSNLSVTPPANSDAGFVLTVTAEATEALNGDTETTVDTIDVTVNAIADAPVLDLDALAPGSQTTANLAGDEDTPVALDLSALLVDSDGSETLSVSISGIPIGATLSDGTTNFTASVGATEVDITDWNWESLFVTPPLDSDLDFALTVTATANETANGDSASTIGTINLGVTGTVDTPTLDLDSALAGDQTVGAASGDEDTPIALDLSAALVDTDGSETLSVVVSGIPVGAVLSDGTSSFAATPGDTEVDVAGWNQATLTVTPPPDSDSDFQLAILVTADESGATASVAGTIDVTVNAIADAPLLDLNASTAGLQTVGAATGDQDSAIAIDVAVALSDTDGSESLSSLVISAIPVGATISDGTNVFTADATATSVDVMGWDLAALSVTPPLGSDLDFQLQVTATSVESVGGDSAVTQGQIDITVLGEVGAPAVHLGALSPATGFAMWGADQGDQSGWSVSEAGDFNGDGFDDFLIGAINGDGLNNAVGDAGEVYLVFGKASGFSDIDLGNLSLADGFMIGGADMFDGLGGSVSSAGDINGDGFDDIIIGASNSAGINNSEFGAGEAYVIFGQAGGFSNIDLGALSPSEGFALYGADVDDHAGFAVSSAGDINGDGFDDIIVGAYLADGAGGADYGESYVIFGDAGGFADIDLGAIGVGEGFTISGAGIGDQAGWSVASAGDVNGDGFDDLIIGAPRADGSGDLKSNSGESYIVYGKAGGFTDIDLSAFSPADGFTVYGADGNDRAGYSVSSAGDVNGDGYADVIIGAIGARGDGNATFNSGEAYVVFGSASGIADVDLSVVSPTDWFTIRGTDALDSLGRSVSSAGDVNGDGFDDIIVGAWFADGPDDGTMDNAGEAYVIFGKADGFGPIEVDAMTPTEGFTIFGGVMADRAGGSVSAAGDINGDGFDDIIVGAPLAAGTEFLGSAAGDSYVIYGSDMTGAVTHAGTEFADTLNGTMDADVMVAGQGDDIVIGGGGADVLIGGAGDDSMQIGDLTFARIDGGAGHDTVVVEGAGNTLDLTTMGSNEIEGVEALDLSGSGANELIVNAQDVLQLSDETNDLHVLGDGDDTVTLQGDFVAAGQEVVGTTTFDVYVSASTDARVLTESGDVNVVV